MQCCPQTNGISTKRCVVSITGLLSGDLFIYTGIVFIHKTTRDSHLVIFTNKLELLSNPKETLWTLWCSEAWSSSFVYT